jgi:predicted nucleic acid-binding protein
LRNGVPAAFFVDTSAWYPLTVARHPDHTRLGSTLRALTRNHRRVVTTNRVVAETQALLIRRVGRAAAPPSVTGLPDMGTKTSRSPTP